MDIVKIGVCVAVGSVLICASCLLKACCGSRSMESDSRFISLVSRPHQHDRWRIVNGLHRDYGVGRSTILGRIRK